MTTPTPSKTRRLIVARRTIALGTTLATAALGSTAIAAPILSKPDSFLQNQVQLVQQTQTDAPLTTGGEGEGAVPEDPAVVLLRDLGRIDGHLRAGVALIELGDRSAAQSHLMLVEVEDFNAAANQLAARGYAGFDEQLASLDEAAKAEQPLATLRPVIEDIRATRNALRGDLSASQQASALVSLTRYAAERYGIGTQGGAISNLTEYQNSWGFLRAVEAQATTMSQSTDTAVATAGTKILGHLAATAPAFGDMQGQGVTDMRASLIYGAAARIELATIGLQ